MRITLTSSDNLRIYGNVNLDEVWQDIDYENNSESLMLPLYPDYSYFKPYLYEQTHDNGYKTVGIILIQNKYFDSSIELLTKQNVKIKKLDFKFD